MVHPSAATGIEALDKLLHGGLPVGAISEISGPECSGRTAIALSFLARMTQSHFCAWVDAGDAMDPVSAASVGVDLNRLLWVRCGVQTIAPRGSTDYRFELPAKYLQPEPVVAPKGLPTGSFGMHPRSEVKGMHEAVGNLFSPRCAEPQKRMPREKEEIRGTSIPSRRSNAAATSKSRPWPRIEQALRAMDLILQTGGFRAVVLDLGGYAPEFVTRIPLATWFRYRAAAERTQASLVLLTQTSCAKSSAELLLRMHPPRFEQQEATVFIGMRPCAELLRRRFTKDDSAVVPLLKQPQRATTATWTNGAAWVGPR